MILLPLNWIFIDLTIWIWYPSQYQWLDTDSSTDTFKERQQTDSVLLTWARIRGDNKSKFVISAAARVTLTYEVDH